MRYFAVISLIFEALLASLAPAFCASLTVQWDPSPDPEVAGYILYYGAESHAYTNVVLAGSATTVTVDNLADGITYFFAATSLSSEGIEGNFSSELVYQMPGSPCLVSISGLEQVYDGTPKPVWVATAPPDLPFSLTYSGLTGPPIEAGYYLVTAVSLDSQCGAQSTAVLTINPANASVQLDNLEQDYDGTPRQVTAITDPPDLPLLITYNGSLDPPIQAGLYVINATIMDNNYTGGISGFLQVNKAAAQLYLAAVDQVYNGTPPQVWTLTSPPGLPLTITYNGSSDPPTDAGSYQIDATIDDPNFFGANTVNMVIAKADLPIQLADLNQVYDGAPKPVSATTPGFPAFANVTYDGVGYPPVQAGTYSVTATIDDYNFQGVTNATLVVTKAHATVTLSDLAQVADGMPKSVSADTDPGGLYVVLKYVGQRGPPSGPGKYVVSGIVYDPNFEGSASAVFTIAASPASPTTVPSANPPAALPGPLVLSWSNAANGITVWATTNLTDWTAVTNRLEPSGSLLIQPGSGAQFFKATSQAAGVATRIPINLR